MPQEGVLDKASFRMPWYYRPAVFGGLGLMVAVGTFLIVAEVTGSPPDMHLWFVLWWWFGVAWFGYWVLLRTCYSIEFVNGALHWRAPLRSGWLPVSEIRGARPAFEWMYRRRLAQLDWESWYDRRFCFIEAIDLAVGRPLLVFVTRRTTNDLAFFLDDLQKYVPSAPMRYGRRS